MIARSTLLLLLLFPALGLAHTIGGADARFVQGADGAAIAPFMYLGAKHMVTGFDHLLYLAGIVFFLTRARDLIALVSLFALGHSITLISGVLMGTGLNSHLVDAVIGFSIVYKAFENLNGFEAAFGVRPPVGFAVFAFGLCHGLGLATKLEEFHITGSGLVTNLISFNVGVELGQLVALGGIVIALMWWRRSAAFARQTIVANSVLMTLGFTLAGYQLLAYRAAL